MFSLYPLPSVLSSQTSLLQALVIGDDAVNSLTIAGLTECTRVVELVYLLSRRQHLTQWRLNMPELHAVFLERCRAGKRENS